MEMVAYEKEFKEQAVKMAGEVGTAKAARDLGIPPDTLYGWVKKARQYGEYAHVGSGKRRENSGSSGEIARLQKRIREVEKANQILKDALSFFVVGQKK
jgi:transposase